MSGDGAQQSRADQAPVTVVSQPVTLCSGLLRPVEHAEVQTSQAVQLT